MLTNCRIRMSMVVIRVSETTCEVEGELGGKRVEANVRSVGVGRTCVRDGPQRSDFRGSVYRDFRNAVRRGGGLQQPK